MKNYKLLLLACISCLASRSVLAKHILEQVKTNENCISGNFACKIQNEGSGRSLLAEFNQTNRIGCFDRCSLNQLCQHWTWWGENEHCQLFNQCQPSPCQTSICLTGPRNCGMQERRLSAVSGGLSDDASIPNQNMIYMIDEHKVCNLPSIMNELTAMPRSRWGHVSAFIESKFFVCGGTTDLDGLMVPNNTCDAFCVARQQWVDMDEMSENRHGAIGVSLFGKMYVMGGHNGVDVTKSAEVYDPMKNVWAKSSPMPLALTGHCAVTFEDSIIVMGGSTDIGSEIADMFLFNVTSNKWRKLQPMQHARSGHGCSLNTRPTSHSTTINEIIVTGGLSGGQATSSAESFEWSTGTWTAFANLPFNMVNHAQLDLGSPRLYGGNISGSERKLIMQYTNSNWILANVSIPSDLKYHHVTKYPANLAGC